MMLLVTNTAVGCHHLPPGPQLPSHRRFVTYHRPLATTKTKARVCDQTRVRELVSWLVFTALSAQIG